jgi:hypothetical protein
MHDSLAPVCVQTYKRSICVDSRARACVKSARMESQWSSPWTCGSRPCPASLVCFILAHMFVAAGADLDCCARLEVAGAGTTAANGVFTRGPVRDGVASYTKECVRARRVRQRANAAPAGQLHCPAPPFPEWAGLLVSQRACKVRRASVLAVSPDRTRRRTSVVSNDKDYYRANAQGDLPPERVRKRDSAAGRHLTRAGGPGRQLSGAFIGKLGDPPDPTVSCTRERKSRRRARCR